MDFLAGPLVSRFDGARYDRKVKPSLNSGALAALWQDTTIGFRAVRKSPLFFVVAITTLGLGVGANVAMFSVVDAVLLSDLPYANSDRFVTVWNRHTATDALKVQLSGPDFLDYRDRSQTIEDMTALHNAMDMTLVGETESEQLNVALGARGNSHSTLNHQY